MTNTPDSAQAIRPSSFVHRRERSEPEEGMDQTEELELMEQYYRHTVAWAPSDEEAVAIAQDLLEMAQRGFLSVFR